MLLPKTKLRLQRNEHFTIVFYRDPDAGQREDRALFSPQVSILAILRSYGAGDSLHEFLI